MTMRPRHLAPIALVGLAAALGVFVLGGPPAGAASTGSTGAASTGAASTGTGSTGTGSTGAASTGTGSTGTGSTGAASTGTGSTGTGSTGAASTGTVPLSGSSAIAAGKELFVETCSTCHGVDALGSGRAPNLQGVGGATIDLWLNAGWMPLAEPAAQPVSKPPLFDQQQIDEIVAYVTSLAPGGLPIPNVDLSNANVATGFDLFALNCAGCHTITGSGDALASGIRAPTLHAVSPTQIAEAIETGPGNMPRFSSNQLTPQQINDMVAYVVSYIQHPTNPGGIGLGGVGPVAEGFVGLFVGVGVCMLIGFWVGDRTEDDEEDETHGHSEGGHEPDAAHA